MSPLARGLVNMELHRGDGSLGTFLGVQSGLAMKAIAMLGSEEQKQRWLPAMARLDTIGAFALTEPEHGSDSVALETSARRDGDDWVLDGAKRWIGNGSIADVVVVWARSDRGRPGQGLPRRERARPASRPDDRGQGRARAIWQADIALDGVRVPEAARLPGAETLQGRRPRAGHHAQRRAPGARSATPSPPTTPRSPTPSSASSSASRWRASRSSRTGS